MSTGYEPDFLEDQTRKGRIQQCNIITSIRREDIEWEVGRQVQAGVLAKDWFSRLHYHKALGAIHVTSTLFTFPEDVILEFNIFEILIRCQTSAPDTYCMYCTYR